ncbi:MAG TPA: glycosyltransferase [Thermoanaerobaculia bacterium]|nr:glycosyltransferase [Thermoanaerobaculia bacterium]
MKVSILIPCYNAEPFLAHALESALRQERPADEVVVVDDASTDASTAIAARYPVRLVRLERNSGQSVARNAAVRASTGEVLVWLDADDWFEPRHVAVVVGLLERYPAAAVAFSAVRLRGTMSGVFGGRLPSREGPTDLFWQCLVDTVVPPMSAAVRRPALERVGGYDERFRFAADFDLWLRLSRRERFVSTEEVTSNYRRHDRQASMQPRQQRRAVYESRRLLLERLVAEGEAPLAERVALRMEEIWAAQLRAEWGARDIDALRFLLDLAPLLPRAEAAKRYRWRTRIPRSLIAGWDRLRAAGGRARSAARPANHQPVEPT